MTGDENPKEILNLKSNIYSESSSTYYHIKLRNKKFTWWREPTEHGNRSEHFVGVSDQEICEKVKVMTMEDHHAKALINKI